MDASPKGEVSVKQLAKTISRTYLFYSSYMNFRMYLFVILEKLAFPFRKLIYYFRLFTELKKKIREFEDTFEDEHGRKVRIISLFFL